MQPFFGSGKFRKATTEPALFCASGSSFQVVTGGLFPPPVTFLMLGREAWAGPEVCEWMGFGGSGLVPRITGEPSQHESSRPVDHSSSPCRLRGTTVFNRVGTGHYRGHFRTCPPNARVSHVNTRSSIAPAGSSKRPARNSKRAAGKFPAESDLNSAAWRNDPFEPVGPHAGFGRPRRSPENARLVGGKLPTGADTLSALRRNVRALRRKVSAPRGKTSLSRWYLRASC